MRRLNFILLLLSFMTVTVHAQPYNFFSCDDGLSSSLINDISCDADGYIWIATEHGLNRYDGSRITNYFHDPSDPASIADNFVFETMVDGDGWLYVRTISTVQVYNPYTDKFTDHISVEGGGTYSGQVSPLFLDDQRNVSFVGDGVMTLKMRGDSLVVSTSEKIDVPGDYSSGLSDSFGNIWLVRYSGGIVRIMPDGSSRSYMSDGDFVDNIFVDSRGNVYAADIHEGMYRYNASSDTFDKVDSDGKLPVRDFLQVSDQTLLLGLEGYWVKEYDIFSGRVSDYEFLGNGLDYKRLKVHDIEKDAFGNIWLALYQKGVMMIPSERQNFNYIGHKSVSNDVIGTFAVSSIIRDRHGTLWVGTDNDGVYGIRPSGEVSHYPLYNTENPVEYSIFGLYEDSAGNIWFGTYANGAGYFNPSTGKYRYVDLHASNGVRVDHISAFAQDPWNRIWIASMRTGICVYNPKMGQTQNLSDHIPDMPSNIICMKYIGRGRVCFGNISGAYVLTLGREPKLRKLEKTGAVYTICKTSGGDVWFGTDNGVLIWSPESDMITYLTRNDGLPSNVIYQIAEDDSGQIWLATNSGISMFNKEDDVVFNFNEDDGLLNNEFSKNAVWKDRDGVLWFGGLDGITYFDPKKIDYRPRRWDIRFIDLYIGGKKIIPSVMSGRHNAITAPLPDTDRINLAWDDESVYISFSPVNLAAPSHLDYYSKLGEGRWMPIPRQSKEIRLPRLRPGKFYLGVMAMDKGIEVGRAEMVVHVASPWWRQWWAVLIWIAAIFSIISLILYLVRKNHVSRKEIRRIENERQLSEMKIDAFADLAHELRTPLTLVINPLNAVRKRNSDPANVESLDTMSRNADRMLLLVNQLLDVRKMDSRQLKMKFCKVDMVPYIEGIVRNFDDLMADRQINCSFLHDGLESLPLWIDPHYFDEVLYNLLANALRFTPSGGKIDILLDKVSEKSGDMAEIVVRDSGSGIDEDETEKIFDRFYQGRKQGFSGPSASSGLGLYIARELVASHYGSLVAENNIDGPGASFRVRIPLGDAHLVNEEKHDPADTVPEEKTAPVFLPDSVPAEEKSNVRASHHILVVEDDPEFRAYVSKVLGQHYYVIPVCDGKDAMESIFNREPDLVVSDVMMPRMDGMTLCSTIKRNINLNHIPVILLTAKATEEDFISGLHVGADAYLPKPFSEDVLLSMVNNLLSSRSLLRNKYSGSASPSPDVPLSGIDSSDEKLMKKIMEVIMDNISNADLTAEQLAADVCISRVHLHRKLKELTNQSTSQFIRNTRLAIAAKYLSEGKLSIGDVASAVGFESREYFSTAFKELYGKSPREYMNSMHDASENQ